MDLKNAQSIFPPFSTSTFFFHFLPYKTGRKRTENGNKTEEENGKKTHRKRVENGQETPLSPDRFGERVVRAVFPRKSLSDTTIVKNV